MESREESSQLESTTASLDAPHGARQNPDYICALYDATYLEITRLRDYEWRIAYYFILLSIGAAGLVVAESTRALLSVPMRSAITVVLGLSMIFGTYYLWQTHVWLTQQRNIRRQLEDLMGFYEGRIYTEEPVLPWKGQLVRRTFQTFDVVLPLGGGMISFISFVIYILWRI